MFTVGLGKLGYRFSPPPAPPPLVGVNLLTRSQELDHADWGLFGQPPPTANYGLAPDGSMTAERFKWPDITPNYRYHVDTLLAAGASHVESLHYKSADGGSYSFALRELYTGEYITLTSSGVWQRTPRLFTSSGSAVARVGLDFRPEYGASAAGDILAWGAQLEPGEVMGPYQPTTDAARSRYGPELVPDPSFNNPAAWATQGNWTVSGGSAHGNVENGTAVYINFAATVGKTYHIEFSVANHVQGLVAVGLYGNTGGLQANANGDFSFDQLATAPGGYFMSTGYGNFIGDVTRLSMREVL